MFRKGGRGGGYAHLDLEEEEESLPSEKKKANKISCLNLKSHN